MNKSQSLHFERVMCEHYANLVLKVKPLIQKTFPNGKQRSNGTPGVDCTSH